MDKDLIQKVTAIIERDLRRVIAPQLQTAAGRLQIDYMTRLLRWISTEVSFNEAVVAAHEQEVQSLLCSAGVERLKPRSPLFNWERESGYDIPKLWALADGADAHIEAFERYVEGEAAFIQAPNAAGGDGFGDVFKGGRLTEAVEHEPVQWDEETLSHYLKRKFCAPEAGAFGVTALPGGFGKDTILFGIRNCGDLDGNAVIRKDFMVRAGPKSVVTEFPLLEALSRLGFPVAKPLWSEADETVIGGPFIVSRKVNGSSAVSEWQDSDERRFVLVERFAEILARLHRLTQKDLFSAEDCGTRDAVIENMKLFYDHYRARARSISGRLEAGFSWLIRNNPANNDKPARLVHGDVGFHNILIEDDKINALLDWEFAHFGDPAEDLGYCWQFIEHLVTWDEFMRLYAAHGGSPVDYRTASYYRIWGDVRNAVMGVGAVGAVDLNAEADIRSPSSGLAFGPTMEVLALEAAARWTRSGLPPG